MRSIVRTACAATAVAAVVGVLSATASATTVAPAGDTLSGTAGGNQTFIPSNGTSAVTVTCTAVAATGTIPPSPNNALTGGAVASDFATGPTYSGCSTNIPGSTTTVTTSTTNGKWSLGAMDFTDVTGGNADAAAGDVAAIGVPKAGAAIKVTVAGLACTITASPAEASTAIGSFKDGTNSTTNPSRATIKTQIPFTSAGACPANLGTSPSVYSGSLLIKDATHTTSAVTF